jgi:hypothetical protein
MDDEEAMMRSEDRLLYLCCRQEMTTADVERLLAVTNRHLDWTELFRLAYGHGVAPLVYRNLETGIDAGLVVPDNIKNRFKLATYQNMPVKSRQARRLTQVLASLGDEEVDLMVVKGAALDLLVYDEPWYTVSDDIDAVVRTHTRDLADADIDRLRNKLNGLEYEFNEHHDVNLNRALPVDFTRIWQDAAVVEFNGHDLYLMSPEDMLLAVCINSCRKRFFRLRSLVDLAETVRRVPELDWAVFIEKATAYQCNNIAYTAISVARATVGCPLPPYVLENLRVGRTKQRLVDGAVHFLLNNMSLRSLSYYAGPNLIGRTVGWSLLLPYLTYRRSEMRSKIVEALAAYDAADR